jgi:hypothetical protein
MTDTTPHAPQALNHVELVYRPGERELAKRVFEVLGFRPVDRGGTWFTTFVAGGGSDWSNNVLYASEVTPEQWAFEQSLAEQGVERDAYIDRLRLEPQRSCHFGIRVAGQDTLEAACERVSRAGAGGELAGRIRLAGVFRPGHPGTVVDTMVQAFVWTDVVASGLLTLGQHIELQWQIT